MALIVKCRKCAIRIPETAAVCSFCGSADFRYIVDYWPRGRRGGRKKMALPDTIKTAAEAREAERAVIVAGKSKRSAKSGPSPKLIIKELFPDYLSWYHVHRAASSWLDVSHSWENNLNPILGDYLVTEISTEHYSLYQKIRSKTVSNRTANKELDYFSGFLRWLRREKKMDIKRIEYEELPTNRMVPIVLSPDEVVRILSAAETEPVFHALFICLYILGLRSAEARGLRKEDVDFSNQSVRIQQKGGSWKILPINDHVMGAIKRAIAWRDELQKKGKGWKPAPYVFSVRKSGEPLQNVRKAIARICGRAGVTKRVHPHLFRHSIATHMMGADVNMRTIQQYLGHSEISTTAEFYTHVALSHLRNAQNLVDLHKK